MMLRGSDGAMLLRLQGLLVLSSLCSAMLVTDPSYDPGSGIPLTEEEIEEMGSDFDPSSRMMGDTDNNMTYGPGRMFHDMDPNSHPSRSDMCDMIMNMPVPPPIDQIPLFCLCSHCKGTMGPKGDTGDRGPPGQPGSPGMRGLMGFKGRPGYTGTQGMKGQKGDYGMKGSPGATGLSGMKGSRGFKGEKGDPGMEGPAGQQGPQGETGTCPASCETIQGPEGQQGPPGPVGARGLAGLKGSVGPKGAMGNKGDMGTPGDPGLNGHKGDQGEQGVCNCTDGEHGSDGSPGEMGPKGEKGDTGARGVEGPIGPKGDEGMMGHMGPPGPCSPTIRSAFSASINESFPKQNEPVPFPDVFYNLQGNFDPIMGIYTAPINGTYVFSFNLAVYQRPLRVGLFHNFYPVVKSTDSAQQSTVSQTIVLHLTSMDKVWLQVKDGTTNGMYSSYESSSTFSGYLLYPDSCGMPMLRDLGESNKGEKGVYSWNGP
ncbi:complement C1q and tumor necrosis factor-related protein 9-like [Labrus bergylta]|uniref:complement C1q and tumor necrosis factor-related protein 9-like n=1 Tax=Labrus bergylta TaxID=56723 RepID=UPI003313AC4B